MTGDGGHTTQGKANQDTRLGSEEQTVPCSGLGLMLLLNIPVFQTTTLPMQLWPALPYTSLPACSLVIDFRDFETV